MSRASKIFFLSTLALAFVTTLAILIHGGQVPLLQPAGLIALQERTLIINATLLMCIVVVPVFILFFFFAWHYREGNDEAVYMPNWEHSRMDELVWWAIPFEIILVLGALAWTSSHDLDPHKQLALTGEPLKIQVVALDWKWLFIYPAQGVASVDDVRFPVDRQIEFDITADAPMNSFWIPALSGQIYAMTGMVNQLHVTTHIPGVYAGSSANYSGDGFAGMKFTARAEAQNEFDDWVRTLRQASTTLDQASYAQLALPTGASSGYYGHVQGDMFISVLKKFMPSNPSIAPMGAM